MLETNRFLQLEKSIPSRHRIFCEHYVKTGSVRQAEKIAGFKLNGSWGFFNNPEIKLYIEELELRNKQINRVTADMIKDELKEIAFFDVGQLIKYEDGKFILKSEQALKEFGRYIKKIRYNDKTKQTEVEFYDKLDALDKLAKHLGFYEKDNSQKKEQSIVFYLPNNGREDGAKTIDITLEPLTDNVGNAKHKIEMPDIPEGRE